MKKLAFLAALICIAGLALADSGSTPGILLAGDFEVDGNYVVKDDANSGSYVCTPHTLDTNEGDGDGNGAESGGRDSDQ